MSIKFKDIPAERCKICGQFFTAGLHECQGELLQEGDFYVFPVKVEQCVGYEDIWERDSFGQTKITGKKPIYEEIEVPGITLRAYAAIKLKVPDSGIEWLDEMIKKSLEVIV